MIVVAENLSWGVRNKTIVSEVSLSVAPGETLGLIGPNGSGKSSLLRLLAGLKRPMSGRVKIQDRDIAEVPRRVLSRQVAFVQQNAATDTNVSVLDVVRLGRTPHRSALSGWSADDQAAVTTALERVDMTDRKAQAWQTLSGGERQRVHIARALAQSPKILFLDEPTNHLDIHHQIEILRLVRDLDLTSVVALHDLNLAAMFCDRIVVLQEGRVSACGSPETVLTEPLLRDVFRVEAGVSASPFHSRPHIHFMAG
ncbi:MAG: ABC transporter ATP-binding protein [Hoeflea sp.]|uniref:ABC transporter ATP-binding protein n=1 Tax=Hoeflea sp. TaxID=1940281 RepID=UPI001D4004C3|nr:ABC transporter ATP-binding protein [Hoeflea sp.]MBU4530512.1 ABC transporter ATP-binding protein [Alphaproteobacteria bacterium]MBU4545299.1 ABC transporter ATP-binding protein [Alphaproteobacteria bacterium]MBU4548948.1 ABC transporter ATP-binding protein [Alphaproteobacteria bacterium]MBV1722103.1 ABC transporter ATP-binding protein [Hoeflea sp.]MBV1761453.1 ABC transporter ATP-binding protein [Hoeflea sp.]